MDFCFVFSVRQKDVFFGYFSLGGFRHRVTKAAAFRVHGLVPCVANVD